MIPFPMTDLGTLLGASKHRSDLRLLDEMLSLEERIASLKLRVALLELFIGVLGLGQVVLGYFYFVRGV